MSRILFTFFLAISAVASCSGMYRNRRQDACHGTEQCPVNHYCFFNYWSSK